MSGNTAVDKGIEHTVVSDDDDADEGEEDGAGKGHGGEKLVLTSEELIALAKHIGEWDSCWNMYDHLFERMTEILTPTGAYNKKHTAEAVKAFYAFIISRTATIVENFHKQRNEFSQWKADVLDITDVLRNEFEEQKKRIEDNGEELTYEKNMQIFYDVTGHFMSHMWSTHTMFLGWRDNILQDPITRELFETRKEEDGHDGGLVDETAILYTLVIERVNNIAQKYSELDALVLGLFKKVKEVNSEYSSEVDESKDDSRAVMLSVIEQFVTNQEKYIEDLEIRDNNFLRFYNDVQSANSDDLPLVGEEEEDRRALMRSNLQQFIDQLREHLKERTKIVDEDATLFFAALSKEHLEPFFDLVRNYHEGRADAAHTQQKIHELLNQGPVTRNDLIEKLLKTEFEQKRIA